MNINTFIIINRPLAITEVDYIKSFFSMEHKIEKVTLDELLKKNKLKFAIGVFGNLTILFGGGIASLYEHEQFYPIKANTATKKIFQAHKSLLISNHITLREILFYANGKLLKRERISMLTRTNQIVNALETYLDIQHPTSSEIRNMIITNTFRETPQISKEKEAYIVHYDKQKMMDEVEKIIPDIIAQWKNEAEQNNEI